ncbi:MAG: hypothetical protein KatS3mg051_2207 [Anaerolineae bacterium]|nr:MAG: hypothetical protein KatS3mg051_2207 [Anaerolineae bacterium]
MPTARTTTTSAGTVTNWTSSTGSPSGPSAEEAHVGGGLLRVDNAEPTLTRREAAGLARLVDTEMPGLTRSERLGWASRVIGRPIQTFKDLTRAEARVLRRELLRDTVAHIGG